MSLRPTIEDLRGLGHHQTTYDWGIQFISLPSLVTGFSSDDLNTRCTSSGIPNKKFDAIPLQLRGHKAFQHGIIDYGNTLSLTLYETVDSKVQEFLTVYSDIQWTPLTGAQVAKSLNQCSFLLTLLDSENEPVRYYTIMGAWLMSYQASGDLQSQSSDVLSWTTEWSFDYWI